MASDTSPHQALHYATAMGNLDGMREALANGAGVNFQSLHMQDTPLHVAIMAKSVDAVHLLLDAGAELNVPNRDGRTALHEAAFTYEKQPEIWRALVERGARTDIPDNDRQTPMQLRDTLVYGPAMLALAKEQGDRAMGLDRGR